MGLIVVVLSICWLAATAAPLYSPVSIDRMAMRAGMPEFWRKAGRYPFPANVLVRTLFCIAYVFFLLPLTRPWLGMVAFAVLLAFVYLR